MKGIKRRSVPVYVEISEEVYKKLQDDLSMVDKYTRAVAANSCFKPSEYGFVNPRLSECVDEKGFKKYYVSWFRD